MPSRSALALLACGLVGRIGRAQGPAATEFDAGGTATWARRDFYGLSIGAARRPGGQGRAAVSLAGGMLDDAAAVRIEATGQFLVLPGARTGVSPYVGLGVVYQGARQYRGMGAIVALVGLEAPEGRRHGWFAELGLGSGVRVRGGYRWRRLPP